MAFHGPPYQDNSSTHQVSVLGSLSFFATELPRSATTLKTQDAKQGTKDATKPTHTSPNQANKLRHSDNTSVLACSTHTSARHLSQSGKRITALQLAARLKRPPKLPSSHETRREWFPTRQNIPARQKLSRLQAMHTKLQTAKLTLSHPHRMTHSSRTSTAWVRGLRLLSSVSQRQGLSLASWLRPAQGSAWLKRPQACLELPAKARKTWGACGLAACHVHL